MDAIAAIDLSPLSATGRQETAGSAYCSLQTGQPDVDLDRQPSDTDFAFKRRRCGRRGTGEERVAANGGEHRASGQDMARGPDCLCSTRPAVR
jgi:hypothetical protein